MESSQLIDGTIDLPKWTVQTLPDVFKGSILQIFM